MGSVGMGEYWRIPTPSFQLSITPKGFGLRSNTPKFKDPLEANLGGMSVRDFEMASRQHAINLMEASNVAGTLGPIGMVIDGINLALGKDFISGKDIDRLDVILGFATGGIAKKIGGDFKHVVETAELVDQIHDFGDIDIPSYLPEVKTPMQVASRGNDQSEDAPPSKSTEPSAEELMPLAIAYVEAAKKWISDRQAHRDEQIRLRNEIHLANRKIEDANDKAVAEYKEKEDLFQDKEVDQTFRGPVTQKT